MMTFPYNHKQTKYDNCVTAAQTTDEGLAISARPYLSGYNKQLYVTLQKNEQPIQPQEF